MTNLTQTTLSDAVKTQYERRLLTRAVPRLVHGRNGIQARLNKFGSYELRKYGSLSAITSALLLLSFSTQHLPESQANSLRMASNASGIARISFLDFIIITATGKGHHETFNLLRCEAVPAD